MVKGAAVWMCLFVGVLIEAYLMGDTVEEFEITAPAPCEVCQRPAQLCFIAGAGWLCENCDLEHCIEVAGETDRGVMGGKV